MAGTSEQQDLLPILNGSSDTHVVNDRCLVRTRDGHRIVVAAGVPVAQYAVGDRMAEAHAMVSLVEQGWAHQNDVARAFGCTARTVRRHQRRFEAGGLSSLGRGSGYPKGRARLKSSRRRLGQIRVALCQEVWIPLTCDDISVTDLGREHRKGYLSPSS